MGANNQGKVFEANIEKSAADQKLFFYRIKDVNPMFLKRGAAVSKNKYDCFLHFNGYLFPFELKSTKNKSISFSEKIIKGQQIKHLKEATKYPNIIPGFLFQFREPENKVYFVHINDFLTYKNIAENQLEHTYNNKVNKASIPIAICEEIGTEVRSMKKKVNYTYYLNKLCGELINKFSNRTNCNAHTPYKKKVIM
ncbi:Holliday junction resolvase RecU [Bacillus subtilis]|uniref:Holliday junction resolvase RecU n=1 Tax=Bacillus subtilis TaxID=1423 RepID=UPI00059EC790|nr:Holliday junction resolvase RecU [Bacillus subtilis]MCG3228983.1 Holliday junction resolvase RecU [Bacillus subtilis]